ncbi:MAG: RNA polymerase sigma factor [Planctomycetota bacterium]
MSDLPEDQQFRSDLAAAKRGDRQAFERLLSSVDSRLKRRSQSSMGPALASWARASDIVQASYVRIVEQLQRFEGETLAEFRGWVERIAENRAKEEIRYARAQKRKPPSRTTEFQALDSVTQRPNPSPVTRITNRETSEMLEKALSSLSESKQAVLRRISIEGEDVTDVAADLGRTVQATRMLLSRARAALALELEKQDRPE